MALKQSIPVSLPYGREGRFSCQMDSDRVAVWRPGPRPISNLPEATRQALSSPLDFPTLDQAVVSDDQIVIALDRHTPGADTLIAEIWKFLSRRDVDPANVTILQPAELQGTRDSDPRARLPQDSRSKMVWKQHDPTDEQSCAYLATASTGERVYLARELLDAGFVLPVGGTSYDPLLGYRGPHSAIYPGLSNVDALRKIVGHGHQELSPHDVRPLRQLVDEVAWLLGIQFAVQVVASEGTGVCSVMAGSSEAVQIQSEARLDDNWLVSMPERVETVVVAVGSDTSGHGWSQIGRALATARQLVTNGGRIIVLSELAEPLGDGMELLRQCEAPQDGIQQLRVACPVDMAAATELAAAASRARIYFMSRLDPELVEELFMYPLENGREVERLLIDTESCALIGSAQHTFGIVD